MHLLTIVGAGVASGVAVAAAGVAVSLFVVAAGAAVAVDCILLLVLVWCCARAVINNECWRQWTFKCCMHPYAATSSSSWQWSWCNCCCCWHAITGKRAQKQQPQLSCWNCIANAVKMGVALGCLWKFLLQFVQIFFSVFCWGTFLLVDAAVATEAKGKAAPATATAPATAC